MKKVLIGGAILAVLGAGYLYYKNQINLLSDMKYTPIGYRFESIGLDKTVLNVDVKIESKSRIEALVEKLDLMVYIDNVNVGRVQDEKPLLIPAKGYSIAHLKVEFSPKQIGQNIISLASDFYKSRDLSIRIDGKAKVKTSFIRTTMPISYATTLKEMSATKQS